MQMQKLRTDMIAAMKAHDKERKDVLSSLVAAVKNIAINEGTRDDISEEQVDRAILKELHTAEEQVNTCPKDRPELLAEYQYRLDVIREYAPKMMSKEEITALLKEKFSDVLATKNMGQIMKTVMPELKGKADGKLINQTVKELCQK
ncbi:MAG: GatB/YqeY domain-containing protein [Eubacteriales bacterium]|nr:GatB/YqeY domain-containing protein [Eubacteriales bacterium]